MIDQKENGIKPMFNSGNSGVVEITVAIVMVLQTLQHKLHPLMGMVSIGHGRITVAGDSIVSANVTGKTVHLTTGVPFAVCGIHTVSVLAKRDWVVVAVMIQTIIIGNQKVNAKLHPGWHY